MSGPVVGAVGASARAAVGSLRRAGFGAWAVDQFGDRDLQRGAPFARCSFAEYPAALPALASAFPPGPFLYTGGLENHPDVVAKLAACRPLWGNPPAVLAKVRDPFWLRDVLTHHDLPSPRLLPGDHAVPSGEHWLRKSVRSAGGLGVRDAVPGEQDGYLQEFLEGEPYSAVFTSDVSRLQLFGLTRQLIGSPWLHTSGFLYAGNIGPVRVPERLQSELLRIGHVLHTEAGLNGVWGVDFLLRDGVPYPVEVNPRYTASVEVLELATGRSVFAENAHAPHPPRPGVIGKAIFFAPRAFAFPAAGPWDADLAGAAEPWRLPGFADIPAVGEPIETGHPVLTLFAAAATPEACQARLRQHAAELDTLFA